ncbi:hypothetical protein GX50_05202 [[Emmonsia] crescens]|uniref:Aminoglycoside phosphotransferase domain-containing protein n=1 Tax=[Emmonsia] crescens TaxID=73230 RepID=A0A2B7ZFR6_9EURO|nr:hypothetical protein GX50_05202 [Emmonsia crescens]
MADISLGDRDIIAKYPLNNSLEHLRDLLEVTERACSASVDPQDKRFQMAISRLLYALQGVETALELRSPANNQNVASELANLLSRLQNNDFNYEHYRALMRLVLIKSPDVDIWKAVLNLIVTTSQSAPPASLPAFDGTPTEDNNDHVESNNLATPGKAGTAKPRKLLLNRLITLSSAEDEEEDMRAELQYATKRANLYTEFQSQEEEIRKLIAFHCGLANPAHIQVPEMFENDKLVWKHGSFNMCIPIYINSSEQSLPAKMGFRVPLPYKTGEEAFPGNAEEKVRSEAATYIWINGNCPDIPIPKLRGFGVPGGLSFFDPEFVPLWQRVKSFVWRFFCRLSGSPGFCEYIPLKRTTFLEHGYILIDWIESESAKMLSNTFTMPHTEAQTQNLYQSMARIMISLAKVPQPRIGSWTIDNDGRINLSNRPMLCHLHQLENWAIPTSIPRNMTYTSADSFYLDLLASHDNRLQYQGNAAYSEEDARTQAKDLVLMRATLHKFTDRYLHDGPFIMQLTDMHTSNIFVDKDWNIKHIIDLEWACSLPLGDLLPPFWLTGKGVDQIKGSEYKRFKACYERFMEIFEQEEMGTRLHYDGNIYSRAMTMRSALENGRYWYSNALQTPRGLFNIFRTHLEPFYEEVSKESLCAAVSPFWTSGMTSFVNLKLKGFTQYRQEVRNIFNSGKSGRPYF